MMLHDLVLAPILIALLFIAWIGVQRLWRLVFEWPDHADVLAGRSSCAACPRAGTCEKHSTGEPP
jgi:hypothetical protein